MYASDFNSKQKQRHVVMKHMNTIITTLSQETVVKIGRRTGSTFCLNDSLEEQFKDVKLRGFIKNRNDGEESDVEYRNIFEGFNSRKSNQARKKWIVKEKKRMKDRMIRNKEAVKRKKEKEAKKLKRAEKKKERNKGRKKGRKKAKKRRIAKVQNVPNPVPRKQPRLLPELPLAPEIEEDSKSIVGSDEMEDEMEPLRGGALLFRKRRDRTMVLKLNIDNE